MSFQCDPAYNGFRATYYIPTWNKYNNTVVPGVQWLVDRTLSVENSDPSSSSSSHSGSIDALRSPFASGVQILCAFRDLANPKESFQWDGSWFGHPGTELIDQVSFDSL